MERQIDYRRGAGAIHADRGAETVDRRVREQLGRIEAQVLGVVKQRVAMRIGDLGRLGEEMDAVRLGQFRIGEVEPIDPVAGHIPTALSAPTDGNVAPDGRFLPVGDLRARFEALGAGRGRDVVTYCGSGVSACHNALAMRIAGLPDAILYPGSWSDWSTAGYPVATGPEPGTPPDEPPGEPAASG